jgi:hypothetical protein
MLSTNNLYKMATTTRPIGRKLADFSCFAKIGYLSLAEMTEKWPIFENRQNKKCQLFYKAFPIAVSIAEKYI